LTAITPIHIGTGEDFEPTNYIIDNNSDGKPRLYEFDEYKFFSALPTEEQKKFTAICSKKASEALYELHYFIKQHRQTARASAKYTDGIPVLGQVTKDYVEKIGQVQQYEGSRKNTSKVFNEFRIAKTFTNPNSGHPILPGSSLKGSISTAFQEKLFKEGKNIEQLMQRPTKENLFRHFLVSDANPIRQGTFIGYALNKERFEEENDKITLKTILHGISAQSEFGCSVAIRQRYNGSKMEKVLDMEEIIKSCKTHYNHIFDSMFHDVEIAKCMDASFVTNNRELTSKLSSKQFLIRVGKHSGARAVTIDGMRRIKTLTQGGGKNRKPYVWDHNAKEETTTWLRGCSDKPQNLLPFGWLLCEIIE
jgi:CRISPR-associated protein Csm5